MLYRWKVQDLPFNRIYPSKSNSSPDVVPFFGGVLHRQKKIRSQRIRLEISCHANKEQLRNSRVPCKHGTRIPKSTNILYGWATRISNSAKILYGSATRISNSEIVSMVELWGNLLMPSICPLGPNEKQIFRIVAVATHVRPMTFPRLFAPTLHKNHFVRWQLQALTIIILTSCVLNEITQTIPESGNAKKQKLQQSSFLIISVANYAEQVMTPYHT